MINILFTVAWRSYSVWRCSYPAPYFLWKLLPLSYIFDIIGHFFASIGHTLFEYLSHLPPHYAYIVLGAIVLFESTGIPLPAETLLVLISVYAARTHHLSLGGVMASAIIGAIIGDNIGYIIGHRFGYGLLEKHGSKVGLTQDRLTLGRYLFRRFGGVGVLLGRFLAVLRIFIALLAGATRMPWGKFTFYNALGGILWGGGYTFIAYTLGEQIERFSGPVGLTIGAILILAMIAGFLTLRRHEQTLLQQAYRDEEERAQRPKRFGHRTSQSQPSGTHDNHYHDDHH